MYKSYLYLEKLEKLFLIDLQRYFIIIGSNSNLKIKKNKKNNANTLRMGSILFFDLHTYYQGPRPR